jgi:aromatic ring-cleaving dioxygenase
MYETHIKAASLPTIEAELVAYRVHCSILIREKSNYYIYDHKEDARWLGTLLELNSDFIRSFRG